jgi:hypothetical protein
MTRALFLQYLHLAQNMLDKVQSKASMNKISKRHWIKYLQWLFRVAIVVSIITSLIVLFIIPYKIVPKQLDDVLGPWFFWYSVPALFGAYIVLVSLWRITRKNNPIKPAIPKTDLWFLLAYISFWLIMVFLTFWYGF